MFLALTLVVGMLPAPAFAQETEHVHTTEAPTEAPTQTEAPAAPTQAPTEAPTEAPSAPTQAPTEAQSTEPPVQAFAEPAQDEDVAAVQAMIDALPDVSHMSESYLDALEAAYSAFDALSESQQAQINGVEKLEALFNWVNSQVSTLAAEETISGEVTWNNRTFTTPVKLTGETTLTLVGNNKIQCDAPLDLNDYNLTIKGTGTLEVVGDGRSKEYRCNGAIFDSTYTGSTASAGTLFLESGTVKASGGTHNAISLYAVNLKGGSLEAYGGVRSGLACSYLYARSGSIYATGGKYGIYAAVFRGAFNPGNLPILASDEKNASMAEMDEGNLDDINDNAYKKTYYIGDVTGPMLSVKAQKGYLYEGTADQTATFSYSAKNLDGCMFGVEWTGAHPGLTADFSENGDQTIIVTTKDTVKRGTYELKLIARDAENVNTLATKTFTVTVLGAPITVTTQPKDASASCKGGDLDSWQGDKKTQVTATRAEGLTEDITFQWKLEGGTKLDNCTGYQLFLQDLFAGGKLPQVADKPWLLSAKVYCTLTCGSYSVNTDPVTLTVNICAHKLANPEGNCRQCGEPCSSETLLVSEDGTYNVVNTFETGKADVSGFLTKGGIFYLTKDVLSGDINAGNTMVASESVTLDLQKHTLESLNMGNFPYGSFTLKNGTLNQCVRSTATKGKLILDGVTFGDTCWEATNNSYLDITVRGNTVFQANVSFSSNEDVVHLQGGTFKKGIDTSNGAQPLKLLADGFAFQNDRGIVNASIPENLGGEIQVVAHTCKYVNGKCECGRTCDHKTVNADGYCTFCQALVEPYAIGQTRYKSLEAALDAAKEGDTITLRGDFYQGAATVEINKPVTLDLDGHTLTSDADGAPVLRVLAEKVTIRNGTVKNTRTAKSSPAVAVGKLDAIGGLTVKSVTFIGSSDGNAPQQYALNIQNGHAKVESGTFNGGIYVEGNLTMTGGSTTRLELGSSQGKAELSGGSFDSINPGNAGYAALLADGYAYQSGTSLVKLADMNDSTKVEIIKCTHPDGLAADTACPYCGKKCGHENTSKETGQCPDCGYQAYRAKIGDTLYETAQAALDAATDRQRVTLLANDTLPDNYVLDKVITLDMNSKKLTGSAMTVTGEVTVLSSGMLDVPMEITGKLSLNGPATLLQDVSVRASGTLILDCSTAVAAGTISVYENGRFELRDGSIGKLHIDGGTATLSAGRIMKSVTVKNGNLQSILAEGKALLLKADGTVIDGTRSAALGNMEIVDHTHTFGEGGKCACGQTAPVQVEAGTESIYYGDFESAVNKAMTLSGSTVRLLKDVTYSGDSSIYIDGGTFTIDWNGHTLSGSPSNNLMVITGSANVTLTDSSDNNTGGARQTGLGGAVYIAVGSEGGVNIQGGTYFPNVTRSERCYGSVRISGGVFENSKGHGMTCALYDLGGRPLSQMLADGTAFAYEADGSDLLDAYHVIRSDSYRTVYAVAHTHEIFDEDGVCTCGYVCPHEHWTDGMCDLCGKICSHDRYENGKCTVCGYVCPHENVTENGGVYTCDICGQTMTVMVETADGNVSYTTDLGTALSNAEDGTTVKLLCDLVLTKGANIVGGNKTVTLNMNGHNITPATWQTIQVKGSTDDGTKAKLVITGSGEIRFHVKADEGGQLDMSGWTGTAACVDLEDTCDFVGPIGDGRLGELNISNWRSDNQGTILLQGGSIGKLWLNSFESFQITLGSLLKPGCAAKSGSEYLPYDRAIQNGGSVNDLTIVPCPHTGLDSSGRCTYCNTTGFVATVTKNGVTTGYTNFQSALDEICDGKRGTLKLLKDVSENGQYVYRISGTLDLNGKNLAGKLVCAQGSNLQIVNSGSDMSGMGKLEVWNGAKVTIADTAGSIFFDMVTVESGSLADLLPEGGAYFRTDMRTWISAAEAATKQTLGSVVVREAPVKSVTLTANKTSVPYGQSQTVTLTASATLSEGETASYAWAEWMSNGPVPMGEDEASFTLPAGVNVGSHIYRVSVTAGSYTLSEMIEITVTKAPGTLVNKNYPTQFTYGDTVPTPTAENFTTNNPDGTFSYYWETESGTWLEGDANPISAGNYTLHVEVASSGNYEAVQNSFPVTVSPLEITDENIAYDLGEDLIYNGKSQKAAFRSITANGMPLNYTLTGNTATNAGSYTMTVTGQGSFTGSVEIPWEIQPRSLTNAKITQGDSLTYNGREQPQTVASVTVDGMDRALTPGVDFQVSGNTGTNARSYMLAVKPASNNFTGTAYQVWSIAPMDISKANKMTIDYAPLTYNGKPQTPTGVTVIVNGLNVTVDVTAAPQTDAGLHDLTVTGTGNFTGTLKAGWRIDRKSIEGATVNLDKELTYNGQEQTQNVSVVTVDGIEGALVKGTDFEITGNTGTDAGGYTLTIKGDGNFTGRKDVPWSIAPKDIKDAKVELGAELTYNFEKQTQTIASVTVDGLDVPTYTVIGNTGTDAGDYTLTVVADGNFTGTRKAKWKIAPMDISNERVLIQSNDVSRGLIYNGEEQTPNIALAQVLNAEAKKYLAITFQVDVTPQVNVGRYTLGIIGTGNFTGRKDGFNWKINPKNMSNAEVVLGDSLTYNGQRQTQTITSVTVDGLDVTYRVVADSNTGTNADWYDLTLAGTGNFDGIWHGEWEIAKKDVTIENTAVESTKVYDGTTAAKITNTGTLSANYDGDGLQIVSGTAAYDNKNVGTGKTVTFTGFSLTGDQADNYRLVSQPASVTADITAKEITLTVSVKDKVFDGTTKAELDTVTHTDFVAGDDVELVNGEPSFAYPCVRADIPIRFTDFRLTGGDAGNYQLTNAQPEDVTAEIHPTPNYLDVTDKPEFEGKTTVTVDGVEYPIEETGDRRYVNLPETGDLLTIYSFKDGTPEGSYTNYPTGMQVFRITRQEGGAKAEEITELANLLNYAGCSIRVSGKKGIRMITAIDQGVKKSLVSKAGLAGYTLEEYGTVVQWADKLGSDTLNLNNSTMKNYAYKKGKADPIFAKVDGKIQYTNVLVGFTDAQCEPDLVMRPYIKLKDTATGETVTLYGGSVTRSIGYVAWQNRDTYKPGTASYKYVWNIIENVDASKYPN